jgi:hypothetical protein
VTVRAGVGAPRAGRATPHDTGAMGMNPFRPHRRSPGDYVMVAAALLTLAALVIWAIRG